MLIERGIEMRRIILAFLSTTLLLLASCASSDVPAAQEDNDFASQINRIFDEYETIDGQVFIGISGPYTDHEKGYFQATRNAYQMALLYEDLMMRVDVGIDVDTAHNRDSFRVYSDATYDEDRLTEVASRLEIADIQWVGGDVGAVVLAQYINPPFETDRDDVEYVYADGTVFTYYYIQDSMFAAAYEAAVNLALANSDLSVVAENVDMDNENLRQQSWQISRSLLDGFEIVSYSYDPETRSYTCTARAFAAN